MRRVKAAESNNPNSEPSPPSRSFNPTLTDAGGAIRLVDDPPGAIAIAALAAAFGPLPALATAGSGSENREEDHHKSSKPYKKLKAKSIRVFHVAAEKLAKTGHTKIY